MRRDMCLLYCKLQHDICVGLNMRVGETDQGLGLLSSEGCSVLQKGLGSSSWLVFHSSLADELQNGMFSSFELLDIDARLGCVFVICQRQPTGLLTASILSGDNTTTHTQLIIHQNASLLTFYWLVPLIPLTPETSASVPP